MPSSVIRAYYYDPGDGHLDLVFTSGRRYRYHEVPEETFDSMERSWSKGRYFNEFIRDQFPCTLIN